ncbi:MAG: hypothetical protein WKF43_02740 [Acidimicrobiales bacterium]
MEWIKEGATDSVIQVTTGTTSEAPPRLTVRRVLGMIGSVVAFVAYNIWDEALLSTPVVLTTRWLGPWLTFALFVSLYGTVGLVATLLVVRAYRRRLGTHTSRLERWAERGAADRRYRWVRRLLLDSGWPGFVVASFAFGPVVTTWLLVASGRLRGDVLRTAAGSSVIFVVTFVGPYCGLGSLLIGR